MGKVLPEENEWIAGCEQLSNIINVEDDSSVIWKQDSHIHCKMKEKICDTRKVHRIAESIEITFTQCYMNM